MIDIKGLSKTQGQAGGPVKIQRQISLPWSEAFRISLRNVTLRLGRAGITAAGVILGIAFLSSVWTTKVIQEGLDRSAEAQAQQVQAAASGGQGGQTVQMIDPEEKANRDARQLWLVIMSLLVCTVGISNSMLMSVTERFREIGTMKCLGALDSFIVRLFLIESILIGFLGSTLGAILGHLVMLGVFSIKQHDVAAKMNWATMLIYLGFAVVIGTVLALVAAVGPAVRASRMPPAAALQTEV